MQGTSTILKEQLNDFKFYTGDVISDESQKKVRQAELEKAERLGNAYHGKVKISFRKFDGSMQIVETTVWAACAGHVVLKGGINLPTSSITEVDF